MPDNQNNVQKETVMKDIFKLNDSLFHVMEVFLSVVHYCLHI